MKLSIYGLNVALVLLLVPGIARAENPDLMTLIGASGEADTYAARDNNGEDTNDNASTYGLSSSDHNSFAVDYGNSGIVRGHGRCSTRAGDSGTWNNDTYNVISGNFVDSLTDETGQSGAQYCYCQLDSYTASGGSAQALSGPWVFRSDDEDADTCADDCALDCADALMFGGADGLAFRAAMFNAYAPPFNGISSVTTQTYVDNKLATKQARITQTGTNKLMTFGAGTGATPGSRDIVSTLGTSTSAPTVPETGPIVAAVNNKQNALNGPANFVMTGTGTAGTLGEKPVYSASAQLSTALVTAQTINTAAMDAANSELVCNSYVSGQSQTPENCLLWSINQSLAKPLTTYWQDPTINHTSYCFRRESGQFVQSGRTFGDEDNSCSSATRSYLGALNNKSGKWGTVFPYGEISGISKCSDVPTSGSDDERMLSSGDGPVCHCKMRNPVTSKWVVGGMSRNYTICTQSCASYCSTLSSSARQTMFGLIE